MTLPFAEIERKFAGVFGFIRRDLERILSLDPGGNYAAAALITCACETLARYRDGTGEGTSAFSTLLPDGPFRVVAKTLYNLLRNGLVHSYDTADIRIENTTLRLAISWRVHRHLSIIEIEGVPNLVLNAQVLAGDLFKALDEYRRELEASGEARDHFFAAHRSLQPYDVRVPAEVDAWKAILRGRQTS